MKASHLFWSACQAGVILLATLLGFMTFVILLSLPSKFGLHEIILERYSHGVWIFIVGLPSAILFLLGPIYAGRWIFHHTLSTAKIIIKNNKAG